MSRRFIALSVGVSLVLVAGCKHRTTHTERNRHAETTVRVAKHAGNSALKMAVTSMTRTPPEQTSI